MSRIHLVMQAKGGAGKSLVASYIAQYIMEEKKKCIVFDADPLNPTLSRTVSLGARVVNLLANDRTTIIKNAFDGMIEECENLESAAVIDIGSSAFVPMLEYCEKNDIFGLWDSMGHQCIIHSIITGKDFADTCSWFDELMRRTRHVPSVWADVWLNPFTGPVEKDGREFYETITFKENRDRIRGIIPMPLPANNGIFGTCSFNEMMAAGMTFEEYCHGGGDIVSMQTMILFKRKLFALMDRGELTISW